MATLTPQRCSCCPGYFTRSVIYAMHKPVSGGLPEPDRLRIYNKLAATPLGEQPQFWCPNCDGTPRTPRT